MALADLSSFKELLSAVDRTFCRLRNTVEGEAAISDPPFPDLVCLLSNACHSPVSQDAAAISYRLCFTTEVMFASRHKFLRW